MTSELYHHGILGQKWGKKNGPPYPLDSSDHSAAEKKAGWRKSLDKSSGKSGPRHTGAKPTRLTMKERRAAKRKAKEEAAKAKYEADKAKAIKSGSAEEVLRFKGDLTNDEYREVRYRLDSEARLKEISAKDKKTGWDRADKLFDRVGKVTDYANKVVGFYDAMQKVAKIFGDDSLPEVPKEAKEGTKKAKEAADKAKEVKDSIKKESSNDNQNEDQDVEKVSGKVVKTPKTPSDYSVFYDLGDVIFREVSNNSVSSVQESSKQTGENRVDEILALEDKNKR